MSQKNVVAYEAARLRAAHATLEEDIEAVGKNPTAAGLEKVRQMKKRKLRLKERIAAADRAAAMMVPTKGAQTKAAHAA